MSNPSGHAPSGSRQLSLPIQSSPIPQNQDAEKGLLSSLMRAPDLFGLFPIGFGSNHFYYPSTRVVFEAVRVLWACKKPIEFRTVQLELAANGQLDLIGGVSELDSLWEFVPGASGWRYYFEAVEQSYRERETVLAAQELIRSLNDYSCATLEDVDQILAKFSQKTSFGRRDQEKHKTWKEQVDDYIDYATAVSERVKNQSPIRFGLPKLDGMVCPIEPGDFVCIGGPTNSGKSALAAQLVDHAASGGLRVNWWSLEMPSRQLIGRLFAHRAQVCFQHLRQGTLTKEEADRVMKQLKQIEDLPITLCDQSRATISDIRAKLRWLESGSQPPVKLLLVDYLQLMRASRVEQNREREVSQFSEDLKGLAQEFEMVVVGLAQLNKAGDTRDSSAIEMNADFFFVVNEVERRYGGVAVKVEDERRIVIRKARNAPRGASVKCRYVGDHLCFQPYVEHSSEPETQTRMPYAE